MYLRYENVLSTELNVCIFKYIIYLYVNIKWYTMVYYILHINIFTYKYTIYLYINENICSVYILYIYYLYSIQ